jgi:serine/threonine-protein kinase
MIVDPFRLVGQVIDGQFRVDRIVGEGGFSVVYRGHHLGLNEPVAIKVLKLQPSVDPEVFRSFQDRFRDESRIAYRLSRGNLDIVRSITAGTTPTPAGIVAPYMVLEWLDGRSLGGDFRERRKQGQNGRSIDETVKLFDPAITAVAYAHSQGVVHRDLKPGNLFLTNTPYGPRLKVLDFGLAKIVDATDEGIGIVPSAQTVGQHTICSPSYGSPEQFDKKIGPIGPWTDVYALGLLFLEALRDRKVRQGEGIAMCAIEALDPNRQPSPHSLGLKLPPQLEVVLARAVALDPGTRPEDAGVFWGLVKNALRRQSGAPPARPPSPQEMATMVDPGPRALYDEPTRHAPSGAGIPRAAFRSEPPRPDTAPLAFPVVPPPTQQEQDLGGTLVMADAPPRPGQTSPLAATANPLPASGPQSSPRRVSASAAGKKTVPSRRKHRSRAITVFIVVFVMVGLFTGGAYAAYRFVLLPRGVTLPFLR